LRLHDLARSGLIVLNVATAAFHAFRPAVKQGEVATTPAPKPWRVRAGILSGAPA
jgi:hypothetical protein